MSRRQKKSGNPLLDTLSAERERTQDRSRQKTHGSATVQSCCCGAAAAEAASDLENALDVEDLREPLDGVQDRAADEVPVDDR